jgi:ribosome-associated translation inhibitor RaiA
MDLRVRVLPTNLAAALQSHVERRLRLRLGRWAGRLGRVSVRIREVLHPDTAAATACGISVRLPRLGRTIRRESVDADLYSAIASATERIGCSVERELEPPRPGDGRRAGAGRRRTR